MAYFLCPCSLAGRAIISSSVKRSSLLSLGPAIRSATRPAIIRMLSSSTSSAKSHSSKNLNQEQLATNMPPYDAKPWSEIPKTNHPWAQHRTHEELTHSRWLGTKQIPWPCFQANRNTWHAGNGVCNEPRECGISLSCRRHQLPAGVSLYHVDRCKKGAQSTTWNVFSSSLLAKNHGSACIATSNAHELQGTCTYRSGAEWGL